MTKREAKAQLAALATELACRLAAKQDASNRMDEDAFYKACDDIRETEARIWEAEHLVRFGAARTCTQDLISANVD